MVNIRQLLLDILYRLGLIADYVIEEGVIDGWHYTKWKNGAAECWMARQTVTRTHNSVWNGFQYGFVTVTFPFAISNGHIDANALVGSGFTLMHGCLGFSDTRTEFTLGLLGSQNVNTALISACIKGYWKELGG